MELERKKKQRRPNSADQQRHPMIFILPLLHCWNTSSAGYQHSPRMYVPLGRAVVGSLICSTTVAVRQAVHKGCVCLHILAPSPHPTLSCAFTFTYCQHNPIEVCTLFFSMSGTRCRLTRWLYMYRLVINELSCCYANYSQSRCTCTCTHMYMRSQSYENRCTYTCTYTCTCTCAVKAMRTDVPIHVPIHVHVHVHVHVHALNILQECHHFLEIDVHAGGS